MQIFAPLRSSAVGLRPPSPAPPEPSAEKLPSECWEEGPGSGSLSRSEDAPPREEAPPVDGCAAGRRLRRLVASQIRRARGGGELIVIVTGRRATVVLRRGLRPAVIRQRDAQRRKEVRASRQLVELCVVESHPVGATVALELVDRDGTLRRARYERPELAHEHSRGHRARHSSPPPRDFWKCVGPTSASSWAGVGASISAAAGPSSINPEWWRVFGGPTESACVLRFGF